MTTSRSPTPKAGEPISRSSSAPETPRPARQTSLEPTITHELLYESSDPFLGPTTSITAQSHQPLESQRTPPASTSRAAAIPPEASSTRHSPPEAPLQRRDSKRMKRESSAEQSIQSESSTGGQPEHETEDEQGPKWEVTTAAAPPKKKRTRTLTTPQQAAELHALLAQSRFPTTAMREEVGRRIGLSARKVQIWFQNQRQKAKRPRSSSDSGTQASQYPFPPGPSTSHRPLSPPFTTIDRSRSHGHLPLAEGSFQQRELDTMHARHAYVDFRESHPPSAFPPAIERSASLLGPGMPGLTAPAEIFSSRESAPRPYSAGLTGFDGSPSRQGGVYPSQPADFSRQHPYEDTRASPPRMMMDSHRRLAPLPPGPPLPVRLLPFDRAYPSEPFRPPSPIERRSRPSALETGAPPFGNPYHEQEPSSSSSSHSHVGSSYSEWSGGHTSTSRTHSSWSGPPSAYRPPRPDETFERFAYESRIGPRGEERRSDYRPSQTSGSSSAPQSAYREMRSDTGPRASRFDPVRDALQAQTTRPASEAEEEENYSDNDDT